MKFTNEDLMKAMSLQVGDRVKVDGRSYVFEIINNGCFIRIRSDDEEYPLFYLLNEDYEILPRPKRVGDLKCGTQGKDGQNTCGDCPVRFLCEHHSCNEFGAGDTLYDYLNAYYDYYTLNEGFKGFDQEIYDLLKARLDKEVKE